MIKQRTYGDCGIATLLNAFKDNGQTYFDSSWGYEELVEEIGRQNGLSIQELCTALFKMGFTPVYIPFGGFKKVSGIENAYVMDGGVDNYNTDISKKKAIYQVMTKSGLLHFVYFDGLCIYDPSPNSPQFPFISDYEYIVDVIFINKRNETFCGKEAFMGNANDFINNMRASITVKTYNFMRALKKKVREMADN